MPFIKADGLAFLAELTDSQYAPFLRNVRKEVALYREENVALQAEIGILAQQFGSISGAMTVEVDGKEYTLQQAARFLQRTDRNLRKEVFEKVAARRLQDKNTLNELFDKLLVLRQKVAENAGFENYRDYKFEELGRFDYTVDDCTCSMKRCASTLCRCMPAGGSPPEAPGAGCDAPLGWRCRAGRPRPAPAF